jgi:hypothetical protein
MKLIGPFLFSSNRLHLFVPDGAYVNIAKNYVNKYPLFSGIYIEPVSGYVCFFVSGSLE